MRVLIADNDSAWGANLKTFLMQRNHETRVATTGKEAQLATYRQSPDVLVLDMSLERHSAFEVLRYMRYNYPQVGVILTYDDPGKLEALELTTETLRKLGVRESLKKPYGVESLLKALTEGGTWWKELTAATATDPRTRPVPSETLQSDDLFEKIPIASLVPCEVTVLDHYIRLNSGRYLKVLHQGDAFLAQTLSDFVETKGVAYLYFKKSDRRAYINFMNDFFSSQFARTRDPYLNSYKTLVMHFLDELKDSGLSKPLIEEAGKICFNMYRLVERNKDLSQMFSAMSGAAPNFQELHFYATFFSIVISTNLDWSSQRTTNYVAMGALLASLGKIKLDPRLADKSIGDLQEEDALSYARYPEFGLEILSAFAFIDEPVKQIVYQHRETIDGQGFPNKLRDQQIYPLAKIVSTSMAFSELMVDQGLSPLDALNQFVTDRINLLKFDPQCIKSLILGFVRKEQ